MKKKEVNVKYDLNSEKMSPLYKVKHSYLKIVNFHVFIQDTLYTVYSKINK